MFRLGTTFGVLQYLGNPRYLSSTRRYFRTRVRLNSLPSFWAVRRDQATRSRWHTVSEMAMGAGQPAYVNFHDR